MRYVPRVLVALLIGAAAPAMVAPGFAQTCACPPAEGFVSGPIIQTEEPPPPLPVYEQPPIPAPDYVWTPGYWAWNNYDYYWVPGVWVPPPQPGLLWTPGYWAFVGGAYLFRQGYWAPHVGFYGGVHYGYGYNGLGYEGGRWEGNRFVYNTTVNNFGGVRITNVYTQNVTVPPGVGRISYNGGPGGIALRPTPEQERLTTDQRIKPTSLQVTQARTASMEAMQFRSANQGRPAVAATQRPGELTGPGAVPAKAAGSAEVAPAANAPPTPAGEQKLPPGAKPPSSAPNLDHRLPSGSALPTVGQPGAGAGPQRPNPGGNPPASGQAAPWGKPTKGERLNGPKGQEKLAPNGAPGAIKPSAAEKPSRPETAPAPAPQPPQGAERPTPKAEERPQQPQRSEPPKATERPSGPPTPRMEPRPGTAPHGEQRPEATHNRPERKGAECGKPGEPPCR